MSAQGNVNASEWLESNDSSINLRAEDLVFIDKTWENIWWILTFAGVEFGGAVCKSYIRT